MGFSLGEIRRFLEQGLRGREGPQGPIRRRQGRDRPFREAWRVIDQVLARLEKDGRVPRQKLIKIMEVIHMGEDVKKGWHEKF
ncbi:MAG: hypothetical protein MZV63_14420 [Marinilabiliales bacterium]|nr:hypothetical protein [Marinilabiliales bacterium]